MLLLLCLPITVTRPAPGQQHALEAPPAAAESSQAEEEFWIPPPPELIPAEPKFPTGLFPGVPDFASQGEASLGKFREQAQSPPVSAAVKAILGFVALLALAYLGGHPRVQSFERRLNITHIVTAGLPFVILGVAAHHPRIDILSDQVLAEVAPLLAIGLGWIGFAVGFRFNAAAVENLPKGTGTAVFLSTTLPFGAVLAACGFFLLSVGGSIRDVSFIRDAVILATAGAMAARSMPYFLEALGAGSDSVNRISRIIQLEQLAGVLGLMAASAYFRPEQSLVAWHLPGTAWLFIAIGVGTTMGGLIYATLLKIHTGPQFTVVLLGSICFAAGMASYLRLSPVSVCFIAGVVLVNFPGKWKEQVRVVLEHLERPVYFLFLTIAGALWRPSEWQGWVLMAIFATARLGGKWLGATLVSHNGSCDFSPDERRGLAMAPIGALSIAIVVSAQDLYSSQTIPWIVTAVIGGAIATEIFLQVVLRGFKSRAKLPGRRFRRRIAPGSEPQIEWSE
jgi:Kef-type K+ transport system membrane component KefB